MVEVGNLLERFPNAVVVVGAYTIGKERIFKVRYILSEVLVYWKGSPTLWWRGGGGGGLHHRQGANI